VVPGTEGEGDLHDEEIIAIAPKVGFPLLIKATAGGGGKGMREVNSAEELPGLLQAARREAESSFGDGNVYLEKLITTARHIEFQILADGFGNVIHLGERECSLQRRHQKLVEESPSPFIDAEIRSEMGAVACNAAQAVDYLNAGTIEFLVDKDHNYYFLEMNTRLQVEHPVTEMVTGVDIVKEQIRIARGRKMRYTQEDIQLNGWAIECRINAEDPYQGFIPSTGEITECLLPTGPGVRVDTGVYAGFKISPYYDSLISKLICNGETRGEAILRMRRALQEYRILGVKTNIPFHQNIMDSHRFIAGQFDTRFVENRFSMDDAEEGKKDLAEIAAIMATLVAHRESQKASQIVRKGSRDTSNWKWIGRWERLRR
jgi:acetyl/propionyl-CoA carboxylase alpha subunit